MTTQNELGLAKLEARITTQKRRVERLMVQGLDQAGLEAAFELLRSLEHHARQLASEISGVPAPQAPSDETLERARASMNGKPRKARQ